MYTQDDLKYYDEKLNEMPVEVVEKAVEHLRSIFTDDDKDSIGNAIDSFGFHNWIRGNHHRWGTAVRNELRTGANLPDDLLPDKNWDDYYVSIIEIAVGKRECNFERKE